MAPKHGMSRKRKARLFRTGLLVLTACVAGLVISNLKGPTPPPAKLARTRVSRSERRSKGRAVAAVPADLFEDGPIPAYLATQASTGLTAAVYDAVTGKTSLYNPGVSEDTASIMKVDILATLLYQGQRTDEPLDDDQQTLTQEMIEESDNDAAQDLWDDLGGAPTVAAFNGQVGMTQTVPDAAGYWGLSTTTAADQVLLLEKVAYPNALLNDASRNYELGLMENVDPSQAWGVSAGIPAGVSLAIKNGWLPLDSGPWQVNSLGIIDGDGRNYVIAVLTDQSATEQQGIDAIEGLSRLVWNAMAPSPS